MRRLMICLILVIAGFSLPAQVLTASSNPVPLNFGYPDLRIRNDMHFVDENDNEQIDPSEGSIIQFTVENQSAYPAKAVIVTLQELNNIQGLEYSDEPVEIGDIAPGGSQLVQIGISANEDLQSGSASFIFYVNEKDQAARVSEVFAVATNK